MKQLSSAEISEVIKKKIGDINLDAELRNEGTVLSVSDGIVRIHGLSPCSKARCCRFQAAVLAWR